jgi:hypothetical protein
MDDINAAEGTGQAMGVMLDYGGKTAELATIGAALCSFSFLPFIAFA